MRIKSKSNNQCTQKAYIFRQPIQFQTNGYLSDRLLPVLHFTKIRLHVMLLLIYFCANPVNTEFSILDSNIFQIIIIFLNGQTIIILYSKKEK